MIQASPELELISQQLAAERGLDEDGREQLVNSYLHFLGEAARVEGEVRPSSEVDEVWHRHILDTESYARDCSHWFGAFIHHRPGTAIGVTVGAGPHADCGAPEGPCTGVRSVLRV